MLRPYQKAMKPRVTTEGASLGPVTLATALQAGGSSGRGGQRSVMVTWRRGLPVRVKQHDQQESKVQNGKL
jgi:hypothetical protein